MSDGVGPPSNSDDDSDERGGAWLAPTLGTSAAVAGTSVPSAAPPPTQVPHASPLAPPTTASQATPAAPLSPPTEVAARHSGLRPPKSRVRRGVEVAGKRPRGALLAVGGIAAATVAIVAIVIAVKPGPNQPETAPAESTRATSPLTEQTADQPTATSTATANTPASATTAATVATVPSLPSVAGSYDVANSSVTIEVPSVGTTYQAEASTGTMVLTGACDGVGACTATFATTATAGGQPNTPPSPGSDTMPVVDMSPTGPGIYGATLEYSFAGTCSSTTVTLSLDINGDAPVGEFSAETPGNGSAECPAVMWRFTFTSVRTG